MFFITYGQKSLRHEANTLAFHPPPAAAFNTQKQTEGECVVCEHMTVCAYVHDDGSVYGRSHRRG